MKIEVINRQEEFIPLSSDWNRLVEESENPSVFLTHEWYSSWLDSFSEKGSLSIVIARNDEGGFAGVAPCIHRKGGLQFAANSEVTDYSDFIIQKGKTRFVLNFLLAEMKKMIRPGSAISLINIPEISPTSAYLEAAAEQCGFSCSKRKSETAPVLNLPGRFQDYLASLKRKNRHEMKRKARRIEKEPGWTLDTLSLPDQISEAIPDFIRLHANSGDEKQRFWQKSGMERFFHNLANRLSRRGLAELNMLFKEDNLIGALFNFYYLGKLYFYNVAYHPQYARYSPGIYLFFNRIEKAINAGSSKADFLRGREKYKYAFGAEDRWLYHWELEPGGNQV
jgi:CelD/BcsL family acetyltransferase involved in cellulose biosynthesis